MQLRTVLDSISKKHKGYENTLQLNVTSLALSELVNSVALENNLNISVDPSLNQMISYNFFDAQVKDMLVFLYLNFDVEYEFVGSILSIKKRKATPDQPKPIVQRVPEITYNPSNQFLSVDLKGDTLWRVAEQITKLTGKNFVISPEVRNKPLNGFIQNRPFDQVIEMVGKSNSLTLKKEDDFYMFSAAIAEPNNAQNKPNSNNQAGGKGTNFNIKKNPVGNMEVSASNADLNDLLMAAASEMGIHYVLYSNLEGKATLELNDVGFEELITRLFSGSKYGFTNEKDLYVIGELKQEGIRKTDLIRVENRTIESVKTAIPKELTTDLEITEFVELNGLIVTGVDRKIEELKRFISQIDVVVPMVQIDVMLLFSKSGTSNKTGIKAGLKDHQTTTQGDIFPGLDVEMGSETINNFLNALSGSF